MDLQQSRYPAVAQILGQHSLDPEICEVLSKDGLQGWLRALDKDVARLLEALPTTSVTRAFAKKLQTHKWDSFIDVTYEIAVSAIAVRVLDRDTVGLEAPVPGSKKNSDVDGCRNGERWRIETTVRHEEWPPEDRPVPGAPVSRARMDRHELAALRDIPGAFHGSQVPPNDPNYYENPASTTILKIIRSKRAQFERDAVNILVLGQLDPTHPEFLEDALYGVPYSVFDEALDRDRRERKRTGPFNPRDESEDAGQFVEPFQIISALWQLRLGSGWEASTIHRNPNAETPLCQGDSQLLERLGHDRASV